MAEKQLEIEGLTVTYRLRGGERVTVVRGVSLELEPGRALALVGESGSGKSTIASAITGMLGSGGEIDSGTIKLRGRDLVGLTEREYREVRGREIATIPQDPFGSLNPLLRIGTQVRESMRVGGRRETDPTPYLAAVHIPGPERWVRAFPHQLSGGMRQRVIGAMAVASGASVVIADEPTTALDATVQESYLNLLSELRREHRLALLFITHDLGIVRRMCDDVAIMYAGRIVERGPVREVFAKPAHPYTRALTAAIPKLGDRAERLVDIVGEPPDPANLPAGCSFAPRCPLADQKCREQVPTAVATAERHVVACWDVSDAGRRRGDEELPGSRVRIG